MKENQMDKSICKPSSGKPTIPQKPKLPPKPNLNTLHQSSLFGSSSKVAQALLNFEPEKGTQTAINVNSKERRYSEDMSQNRQALVVEARCPTRIENQDISSFSTPNKSGCREWDKKKILEKNCQLAVDDVDVHRSAPDGSEMNNSVSGTIENHQGYTVPPKTSEEKHCHCICHLQRPGMKLVWVPLQDTVIESREIKRDQFLKKEDVLTSNEVSRPQNSPSRHSKPQVLPPCVNCQSFLLHHSPQKLAGKGFVYADESFQNHSNPPVPPRTYQSSDYQNSQQYTQLDHTDDHIYLDLLPSNVAAPAVPPRPPPRLPHHPPLKQKTERRTSQPALACVVSLRGGGLPIRNTSNCERGRMSRPMPVLNPSGESYENGNIKDWESIDKKELFDKTESPRRISSDWEPNSDYEPLYQIYQAKVSKEASQIQTDSPDCNRKSVSETLGLEGHGGLGVVDPRSKRGPEEITLWQDLPVVKESGILYKLARTEIQRQESMFEVLTSEASYLRSLRVLKDHFLGSRELKETMVIHDRKALFSNLLQVYEVSERFIGDLLKRVDESVVISDVCDIIHEHAESYFSVFIDYVRNQQYQEKTYSRLMESNRDFSVVMRRLEVSPLCKRLPFTSFMLLPFQRITRIKILIQNIQKRTAKGTKEEETASKALASVSELITQANTQVGQMKQMEELIHIYNKLEFDKLKAIPLVSKTRCLEKQGELQELSKRGSLFSIRNKCTPVYMFLFNDLLILTTKKSGCPDRFVVIDHAHRSLVQVQSTENVLGPHLDHCFSLTLLENHRGRTCEHLLKANTESDMHRWIAAFPLIKKALGEEKIYEDWDCPQVQCVSQYVGKQADELNLEPSDVINVLRKTSEGWYEGMRLCDGKKGWFPAVNVLEVTSDHQRRRNVRQQYQISQTTSENTPNDLS
ncbi:rho guanine nucleotide exchange factor 15 isoform X1 [Pimephales promelas]|uniref:rho guanine nucleotide exchange factor 15 isoform X1 n=1 Tax=Pimephales promelas TaxID=90988 RepID=UPI001955A29D|nr:rho guanine nucleotide exchange factor 15 isoform X1 [Pimephales promelas]KAG1957277.1 rho guanine nucleotide exchange factor [Pimephales promelas]